MSRVDHGMNRSKVISPLCSLLASFSSWSLYEYQTAPYHTVFTPDIHPRTQHCRSFASFQSFLAFSVCYSICNHHTTCNPGRSVATYPRPRTSLILLPPFFLAGSWHPHVSRIRSFHADGNHHRSPRPKLHTLLVPSPLDLPGTDQIHTNPSISDHPLLLQQQQISSSKQPTLFPYNDPRSPSVQITAVSCVVPAFAISIHYFAALSDSLHAKLGVAVFILMCLQPVMAILRPHKGNLYRPIWYLCHWMFGTSAVILGWYEIYTGLALYSVDWCTDNCTTVSHCSLHIQV